MKLKKIKNKSNKQQSHLEVQLGRGQASSEGNVADIDQCSRYADYLEIILSPFEKMK
tara:strand:+ start:1114 stop:1284 length:171 start_codon:yes stop_codon:yes gene_type:complete